MLTYVQHSLRRAEWNRPHIENVITFTLNSACDSEAFEKIDAMSTADQDRFRGSKFFLLCLVCGTVETALAMEAADGQERLEEEVMLPDCMVLLKNWLISCDVG